MIVTSFSQKGYHEYGKRFINSFIENFSDENLIVFYEHGIPSNAPKSDKIKYVDLFSYPQFAKFQNSIKNSNGIFRGNVKTNNPEKPVLYSFRLDASRFFCKVFALYTASTEFEDFNENGLITWLDADTFSFNKIPENFFGSIVNENYLAYLGRPGIYSECGFMTFNTGDSQHIEFMNMYLRTYLSGAFPYLGEWTDCYVFDFTRTFLQVSAVNIAKGINSSHPFIHTILGKYMDHLKGPQRKELGCSPEMEEIVGSGESAA